MKPYRVPQLAKKYVDYDMIQNHTQLPAFPDSRLHLLQAFLSETSFYAEKAELFALVLSLLQLGLDTHDEIDVEDGSRSEREMRSRQLKVLAGDYFSGRFYQLLAQAGEIAMIAKISQAVCEVNGLKITLYLRMQQAVMQADDYLSSMVQLKSGLFLAFQDLLEGAAALYWTELLHALSRCEIVLEELARSKVPALFHQSWAYWHVLQVGTLEEQQTLEGQQIEAGFISGLYNKYDIHAKLAALLQQAVEDVQMIAAKLESDKLVQELQHITDAVLYKIAGFAPALNETR
ncbi:heptaprenyl diphosphate synthase component 1 [Paenibacillus sp. Leaf72]|uniref:heptaprenyl diphosphate synthase component 1 n=1 Tax=Paenibacillus sp. Leaf72 TaxID=1736234 RepID=UPI0006FA5A44|nr:heptaprenyl diphosphate synthase component 1 [Paenibacillus sp. Leaf72]KQO17401.1 heptaprenyl diphosphate synthase [Paenibacillus sp. Leaf72]